MLVALRRQDGDVTVQMKGVDESVIAAIIRAAVERGCDMGRVFRLIERLRSGTGCTVDEPMVIA